MKKGLRRQAISPGGLQPPQLATGMVLIAIAWPLAWFGPSPYSEYTFFPLWLGYILTLDGVTVRRSGTSLLSRDGRRFALLFAFSTVMPAIFVTAGLYRSFPFFARPRRWIGIAPSTGGLIGIGALGLAMFVASLVFPDVAFPLVWIGLFLLVDAVNALTGGKSIAAQVAGRRWDTVLVLFMAGITCGFFWEMWNYWSLPKWVYNVPHVGSPKLFEMPLLGYGGYFPFALEVYAFYHLLHMLIFRRRDRLLHFDEAARD